MKTSRTFLDAIAHRRTYYARKRFNKSVSFR